MYVHHKIHFIIMGVLFTWHNEIYGCSFLNVSPPPPGSFCVICGDLLGKSPTYIPGRRYCSEGCSNVALERERDRQQALLEKVIKSACRIINHIIGN
jgi:predicted nucleic acid-binding Zn ribbon protein